MSPSRISAAGGRPPRGTGPDINAVPFTTSTNGVAMSLLSDAERRQLALIASIAHVKPGATLYEEGGDAAFL